ncbi:class D beta-lactamase [Parvibaculum sp.]|uniref:class D beta-lactamase n=1 Tax=Parvibaculum sp. TaxID=2024848 RepID=UPI001B07E747|nr:class D beta-lactamase [Parvibaculum sp.]MBO6635401.1 class D beta-lactamase [Parvibaculum sp.]MBO6680337.1 class D beta-lactamase [Parvibaculum sp.]MBO6686046.1 class D beta-lactamase [Parvibaculum sp.]MBO6903880.1 class D beta-lactamase [Parvibaculum sp.]
MHPILAAALAALLLVPVSGAAAEPADLFAARGLKGTFVLYEPETEELVTVNDERAQERFVPASTFKIANSLIALEAGAVTSVDEVLPYGGEPQPFERWERDMSMREAIAMSNVAIYQEVARRIGLERMTAMLAELDYGNRDPGTAVDRFWLDGPLAISAVEEAKFLARLARNELPLSTETQAAVREILLLEEKDGTKLYGKTGWAFAQGGGGLGWFVGWTEWDGEVRAFALNMDMTEDEQAALRIPLAKTFLEELGAW